MRNDRAEVVTRLVREHEALDARMEVEARGTAHGLIQGYLGPDHKVLDMKSFYSARVHALKAARETGQADYNAGEVLKRD